MNDSLGVASRPRAVAIGIMIMVPILMHTGINMVNVAPVHTDFIKPETSRAWFSKEPVLDQEAYDAAYVGYTRNYFYTSAGFGIGSIILGVVVPIAFLGAGFILGGELCLLMGYSLYWSAMSQLLRFLSLLLMMMILIVAGYLLYKKRQN